MRRSRIGLTASAVSVALLAVVALARVGSNEKSAPAASSDLVASCLPSESIPMGQGCCSWHGGECGCQDGRDKCCDGTLSPSCTCHSAGTRLSEEAQLLQLAPEWVNPYAFGATGHRAQGYWRKEPLP
jgi:hypothetical protein